MKKHYLVAVSGGSDSMALLDMLVKSGKSLMVAHVNYQRRASADDDEALVKSYCEKHQLTLKCLYPKYLKGNFQNWAREVRFNFFKELIIENNLERVYLGHQADDLLETYLIQKKHQRIPLYWGLQKETTINGLKISRPLLNYSKADLLKYCQDNKIKFGEDESNYQNHYLRNEIRNTVLKDLTPQARATLLKEIASENEKLKEFQDQVQIELSQLNDILLIKQYFKINQAIRLEVLRQWLFEFGINSLNYSIKYLENLESFLRAPASGNYQLNDKYLLNKSYGQVSIVAKGIDYSYSYQIDNLQELQTKHFQVALSGPKNSGVMVSEDDFPLTIRNYHLSDGINLAYGRKQARRFFIDNKIPPLKRLSWPIVLNRKKEIILIPGLGANITHYSNNLNLFVLK